MPVSLKKKKPVNPFDYISALPAADTSAQTEHPPVVDLTNMHAIQGAGASLPFQGDLPLGAMGMPPIAPPIGVSLTPTASTQTSVQTPDKMQQFMQALSLVNQEQRGIAGTPAAAAAPSNNSMGVPYTSNMLGGMDNLQLAQFLGTLGGSIAKPDSWQARLGQGIAGLAGQQVQRKDSLAAQARQEQQVNLENARQEQQQANQNMTTAAALSKALMPIDQRVAEEAALYAAKNPYITLGPDTTAIPQEVASAIAQQGGVLQGPARTTAPKAPYRKLGADNILYEQGPDGTMRPVLDQNNNPFKGQPGGSGQQETWHESTQYPGYMVSTLGNIKPMKGVTGPSVYEAKLQKQYEDELEQLIAKEEALYSKSDMSSDPEDNGYYKPDRGLLSEYAKKMREIGLAEAEEAKKKGLVPKPSIIPYAKWRKLQDNTSPVYLWR